MEPDPGHAGAGSVVLLRAHQNRIAVVGGGVIGLSVAWRAAEAGYRVTLIDPDPARGASWVAGGMLAPIAEAWPGEESVLELGSTSLSRWPSFAAELADAAGQPCGLRTDGTLVVGVDSADRGELDTLAEHLTELGRSVSFRGARELRRMEPALGPSIRGGLEVPGDLAVDNRRMLSALRAACTRAGVEFLASEARRVRPHVVVGRNGQDDTSLPCDTAILAAGAYSATLHPELADAVRPVKGEILRLRPRGKTAPSLGRTVRGRVHGRPVYLVPREDGELVLGATQYEAGFDTTVTAGGLRDLLRDAEQVIPGIADYAVTETTAGLRAGSPDNVPLIGWTRDGVLAATGHHRNGFLLAPLTADLVVEMLRGERAEGISKITDPRR